MFPALAHSQALDALWAVARVSHFTTQRLVLFLQCCPIGSNYLPSYARGVRAGLRELCPDLIGAYFQFGLGHGRKPHGLCTYVVSQATRKKRSLLKRPLPVCKCVKSHPKGGCLLSVCPHAGPKTPCDLLFCRRESPWAESHQRTHGLSSPGTSVCEKCPGRRILGYPRQGQFFRLNAWVETCTNKQTSAESMEYVRRTLFFVL